MIDVFLSHKRFLEIAAEAGDYQSLDGALSYLTSWCYHNSKFFYVGQRGYKNGQLGFEFRFADRNDALMFKLTWG